MHRCWPLLLAIGGCGRVAYRTRDTGLDARSPAGDPADARRDTPSASDGGDDARPPTATDAATDTAHDDASFDAGFDAVVDASLDTGRDAGFDTGRDAGFDTGRDAGFDTGRDAGLDAGFDTGRDAGLDTGFDAGFDAGLDAGFDTGRDVGPDAGDFAICARPACTSSCSFATVDGANNCGAIPAIGTFVAGGAPNQWTTTIIPGSWTSIEVSALVCAGTGWQLHVADDEWSDGWGGSLSEFHIIAGGNLFVWPEVDVAGHPAFYSGTPYPATGCYTARFVIENDHVAACGGIIDANSPRAIDLDDPIHVGLNRVTGGDPSRVGSGLVRADFCFR